LQKIPITEGKETHYIEAKETYMAVARAKNAEDHDFSIACVSE